MYNYMSQADEKASADMLAVKDSHIAALNTQLEGKDKIIQATSKVCIYSGTSLE